MYSVKNANKGAYRLYESAMNTHLLDRVTIERDLRRAIPGGELRLLFQPEARVGSGEMVGVEALVRWEHPDLGLIGPGQFILIAEETGLIVPLGEWVLREACTEAPRWIDGHLDAPDFLLSVNLSARQLAQEDLAERIETILGETGFPADQLALEITESVIMDGTEATLQALHALKGLGVKLVIDDFGTGYSSLAYLKRFAVDLLKIDRTFIQALAEDAEDAGIVSGIISLAHALGLRVVAEGVEADAQLDRLRDLDCDLAQGFLLARPMPADAINRYLNVRRLAA